MKFNGLLVSLGIAAALAGGSAVANSGKINFSGAIVNSPCSISGDSLDQTVSLGDVSNKALVNSGKSPAKTFEIKLDACDVTTTDDEVTVTFSGVTSTATTGNLAISGEAKGASIGIENAAGVKVPVGTATAARQLVNGTNTLAFSAYLQGDGPSATITPGSFTAVADFKLSYQ